MTKKVLCLVMVLLVTVTMMPYAAAQEETSVPTIEEILADYHAKTFAITSADASAAAYSRQAAPAQSKTMDTTQELANITNDTVNALNNAGYEAYHVTADNYASLEKTLRTDFASLEMDPSYSYIVVISGEEESNSTRDNPLLPPHIWDGGSTAPPEDGVSFSYIYGGIEYTMRYMTVTSANDPDLTVSTSPPIPLSQDLLSEFGENAAETVISIAIAAFTNILPENSIIGKLLSLLDIDIDVDVQYGNSSIAVHAMSAWTFRFLQIWDQSDDDWRTAQYSNYARVAARCAGYVYNADTNAPEWTAGRELEQIYYSPKYRNYAQCKADAVVGYSNYTWSHDSLIEITFRYSDPDFENITVLITHPEPYIDNTSIPE